MASFVSFFYNRGGSCLRSQIRNAGSWFTRRLAIFRVKPGYFDRINRADSPRALRAILDTMKTDYSHSSPSRLAKAFRRAGRRMRELFPAGYCPPLSHRQLIAD